MKLFQAFINEHQKSYIKDDVIGYDASDNIGNNQFEYELFKKICSELGTYEQPWGMVSWKFQHKTLISTKEFSSFAEEKFSQGYDCVFINPMIGNEALFLNVWEQGNAFHPGIDKIAEFIKDKTSNQKLDIMMGKDVFAFCNYFIATPSFWKEYFDYVDNIICSLEEESKNKTEVGQIYSKSHEYRYSYDVTFKPFIIERLFSSFIASTNFKCVSYQYHKFIYYKKFGDQLGSFLYQLSKLKSESTIDSYFNSRNNIFNSILLTLVMHLDDPNQYFVSPEFKQMYGN